MNVFQLDGTVQPTNLTSQPILLPTVVADVISLLIREGELDLAQHVISYYTVKSKE